MSTTDGITSKEEIEKASREDLVAYLESWGFQCYDHETTDQLRDAALDNWRTENGGEVDSDEE